MTTLTEGKNYDYVVNFVKYYSSYLLLYRSMEMVNKGVETRFERIQKDFRAIDFSGNRIHGEIPESLSLLKGLRLLNLSGNAFASDIPRSLANLTNLEALDLSRNKLSGQIPRDFGELSFLSYVNFSHNLLHGPVPRGTQIQRQECSSFLDNPGLYGLEEICQQTYSLNPTTIQQVQEHSETEEQMFSWLAAGTAYGPGVFCGLVIGHIFLSHNHAWFIKTFGRRKRVSTRTR
ncbi:Receptor-like protein 12 [Raphanus sativus]|nr:Receptor-like protein 12 [Raphanus sativus]